MVTRAKRAKRAPRWITARAGMVEVVIAGHTSLRVAERCHRMCDAVMMVLDAVFCRSPFAGSAQRDWRRVLVTRHERCRTFSIGGTTGGHLVAGGGQHYTSSEGEIGGVFTVGPR